MAAALSRSTTVLNDPPDSKKGVFMNGVSVCGCVVALGTLFLAVVSVVAVTTFVQFFQ